MSRAKTKPVSKLEPDARAGGKAIDMSARKAAFASSLTAEEIVSRAYHTAPDAMVVSSAARRILSANAAAFELFGYAAAHLTGQSARTLYGPDEDWRSVEDALRTHGRCAAVVTMRHKSGALFDAEISASATFDAKGRISGVVETIRALKANNAAPASPPAQASNTSAVRLARGLAHDFSNLLAIITGNVQLADRRAMDQTAKRYLRDAELACDMAARLTRRVMSFAEDRRLAADEISVAALLQDQHALLSRAAGDAITVTHHITGTIPAIVTDRSALENALLNLVLNARDAMPSGGTIEISASVVCIVAANAEPHNLDPGTYVCIAVSDTGAGMTARIQERAFDPFFTTKDPGRGTGLGLATVYGFAKQAGGTAHIASAPGKGTTVTLMLPVTPKPSPKRS